MQAIILAGGFGTRLAQTIGAVPKSLAPVGGRPFICWLLTYMQEQGVTEAVLCVHHQAGMIAGLLGQRFGAIKLRYSYEDAPLGTGGAIQRAMNILNPAKPVFVLNGDSLVRLDYRQMMATHLGAGRKITLASARALDCRRYSQLTVQHGLVTNYETYGEASEGDISVGFYVLSPDVFDDLIPTAPPAAISGGFADAGAFSFERDFLAPLVPTIKPAVYNGVDYFIDIGVPEDYARAQREIPAQQLELVAA
jgi:D-glycero-alpha-D-manno-heptose 1-phosphate guanylyltransferase